METGVRRAWHCGWISREEWAPVCELPRRFGDDDYDADTLPCPGYLVRQPQVIEASRALSAFEKGALLTYYPDIDNVLAEAVLEVSAAFNRFQVYQIRKNREKK